MTETEHKVEVEKLKGLEQELIEFIASMKNKALADKFLEWQEQRIKCNEGFFEYLQKLIK